MKYEVLYRKYRPKTFDDLVGHDNILKIILNEIKEEKLPHALLFNGQQGTGKTSVARLIAKTYNCLKKKNYMFCNNCLSCDAYNKDAHPDIIEIDGASNNGVGEIRNLKSNINLMPTISKYKIYIIDEVHMLTQSAFNAFLKTLEEPPMFVIFIFATTEIHKIPQTILSRCQLYNFNKIKINDLVNKLNKIAIAENKEISSDVLKEIYYLSNGSLRDALNILDQLFFYNFKNITLNEFSEVFRMVSKKEKIIFLKNIFKNNINDFLYFINKLEERNIELESLIISIIDYLKEIIEIRFTKNNDFLNFFNEEDIEEFNDIEIKNIINLADCFIKSYGEIKNTNIGVKIILINILKEYTYISMINIKKNVKSIIENENVEIKNFDLKEKQMDDNEIKNSKQIMNNKINIENYIPKENIIWTIMSNAIQEKRDQIQKIIVDLDFDKYKDLNFLKNNTIICSTDEGFIFGSENTISYEKFIDNEKMKNLIIEIFKKPICMIGISKQNLNVYKLELKYVKDNYKNQIIDPNLFFTKDYYNLVKIENTDFENAIKIFGKDKIKVI